MIAIIDYGAGNLQSVKNALDFLKADNIVTNDPREILHADKVILPGVGAFGDAMENLSKQHTDAVVKQVAAQGTPLLGVCLGLHMFFEESEEAPGVKGLGLLRGKVVKIPKTGDIKIPHMGWNSIVPAKESRLLHGLGKEPFVYFVHSYYVKPDDLHDVCAYTMYGTRLDIAVEKDNLFATQFHPEKSGSVGMKILQNFIAL